MAQKLSFYLTDEAVRELDRLTSLLTEVCGISMSRSAAVGVLLRTQVDNYLETRLNFPPAAEKSAAVQIVPVEESDD